MTFSQIFKELENKKYHPVYFLQGEEAYFIDMISNYIENNVLDDSERSFDQTVVYGRDSDKSSIISLAKQFPMMAKNQVVIVKEAQDLKDLVPKGKSANKKKETDLLEAYLENPQKSTILVFCYKYKKLAKNTILSKSLEKNAVLFDSDLLRDEKVPEWIQQYIVQNGHSITTKASVLLSEYLGNDLSKITNEIGKLIINLESGSEINETIIESNIGISKDYNAFELQKAITERNFLKANRIVNYFASEPKSYAIQRDIVLLYRFFIKLLIYQRLQDKSPGNAASKMGVNPYFLKDYSNAAKIYSQQKVINNISLLREFDLKSKGVNNTGKLSVGFMLKEMVFRLMA